jgi:hypothetical protein
MVGGALNGDQETRLVDEGRSSVNRTGENGNLGSHRRSNTTTAKVDSHEGEETWPQDKTTRQMKRGRPPGGSYDTGL